MDDLKMPENKRQRGQRAAANDASVVNNIWIWLFCGAVRICFVFTSSVPSLCVADDACYSDFGKWFIWYAKIGSALRMKHFCVCVGLPEVCSMLHLYAQKYDVCVETHSDKPDVVAIVTFHDATVNRIYWHIRQTVLPNTYGNQRRRKNRSRKIMKIDCDGRVVRRFLVFPLGTAWAITGTSKRIRSRVMRQWIKTCQVKNRKSD